jgi:hypothetical protein
MKTLKRSCVFAVALSALLCAGCVPKPEGSELSVREACIKGVTYYYTGYRLAPAFKPDGTLFVCGT